LHHPDAARGDLQRARKQELPDEQEGEHPAPFLGPEAFPEKGVGAAGGGQRGAQLRHYQAVGQRDHGPHDPSDQRLRAHHGRENTLGAGDGDERPDADHVGHVDGGGVQHAQAAMHLGVGH
jgi:hypothetical protein